MKTNLLILDTLRNMENLISTGFSLSTQLNRKLKITYIFDFSWIGSGEFVGATAPNIDTSMITVEKEIRKDFEKAEGEIRRIVGTYLEQQTQTVPYEIETVEASRLDYINKVHNEEKDLLLLMSNFNSYTGYSTGRINYPNMIDRVECPVLIIPDDVKTLSFNKLVYLTALHPEDITALHHLTALFNGDEAVSLTIFHNKKYPSKIILPVIPRN